MSNLCPACGHENRENARFCAECGRDIPIAVAVPVNGAARAAGDERESALRVAASGGDSDAELAGNTEPLDDAAGGSAQGLAPGAQIGGRFVLLAVAADAAGRQVCQVEDRGICRACGVEIADAGDESFCTNCGAHWQELPLPWPLRQLREAGPEDTECAQFPVGGRAFVLAGDDAAEGEKQRADRAEAGQDSEDGQPHRGGVTLLAGQRTDVGVARAGRPNEDSLLALTAAASSALGMVGIYVVADGMGGHQDGEIASRTACAAIRADLLDAVILPALTGAPLEPAAVEKAVTHAVGRANREIGELAAAAGSNMGTTVVLALVLGEEVYLANVGDSRAWLWERAGLRQITADHSHVFLLLQKGVIEPEDLYIHPRRNEIYRSLGSAHNVEVDCFRETLAPGDLLLLGSDGLWEMLRNEGIADVLLLNLGGPQAICDELVRRANLAGGEDNISVIALHAAGPPHVGDQVVA